MPPNAHQKTKIAMIWNALEKLAAQGVAFALNIVLARLLSPHDYGVIGMLAIFLTFSNVLIDSGFSRALIQKQNRTDQDFSTAFFFNLLVSLALYAILFAASPAIAGFYGTPELLNLQKVFFLVIILNALSVVQQAKLQIAYDFKSIALVNFFALTVSGLVGIVFAYLGYGPWALVFQALAKAGITAVAYAIISKWRPQVGFSKQSFQELFGFGSKLLVSGFLSVTLTNINNLAIGKFFQPKALGFYTRAQQFPELASGTIASVLNTATFPLMASLQNDSENFKRTFNRLIKLTALVVYPSMLGLAMVAKPLISILLGEQWLPAANMLFWLSFAFVFTPLSVLNMNLLNAIGRSDLFLKIDLVKIPISLATMAITFPISLQAVVMGRAITAVVYYAINAYIPGRIYGVGFFYQIKSASKIIIATAIMAVVLYFVVNYLAITLLNLGLTIIIGLLVYVAMLWLLQEAEFNAIIQKIRPRYERK